ncbi:hypothetical protein [Siphonobacter curvatus]|uniref:Uncharacterized protein n=1 Tax=Siphonobacter curvatus TaxID=2094562 RepID=A0A2S7IPQ6_9BACT|nr:hypothetical protein [Siphonobacter curvatus]PQA59707.1 hypothetical protein C5O19_08765 [Siphonobacter curvatus]
MNYITLQGSWCWFFVVPMIVFYLIGFYFVIRWLFAYLKQKFPGKRSVYVVLWQKQTPEFSVFYTLKAANKERDRLADQGVSMADIKVLSRFVYKKATK